MNAATSFRSPLRSDVSRHVQPRDAKGVIDVMRDVRLSHGAGESGMDALAVLVIDMDNIDWPHTRYVEKTPAPRTGDPLHWDAFIERVCTAYGDRF